MLISIVIYNKNITDLFFIKSLVPLKGQVTLFVYDNSKLPQDIPLIENVAIYYEHDGNNNGVSRAYNQAYKKAKELDKELLLLLDQDSVFEISFIDKYMRLYQIYKNNFIYAPIVTNPNGTKIYSPAFLRNFVGKVQNFENFTYQEKYSLSGKSIINSGMMIPLKLFEEIGGFNERLKLDFSDIYFIEKYKQLNIEVVLVDVILKHSISGDEGKNFEQEYSRFKYYCSASREIGKALSTSVFWSPFRRLLLLLFKYKNMSFVRVFINYYIQGRNSL
jgi:GT2 family glycosyltransferase